MLLVPGYRRMGNHLRRKFLLSDAIVLIGAAALAFAIVRRRLPIEFSVAALSDAINSLRILANIVSYVIALLTLAVFLLRLRQPRIISAIIVSVKIIFL